MIETILIVAFIILTVGFVVYAVKASSEPGFEELYGKYRYKLGLEWYDTEDSGEKRFLCFSLGSMLLSAKQCAAFLRMVYARDKKGNKDEKIRMRAIRKGSKWVPQIKFGSYGFYGDITINYYGDCDDDNIRVEYDTEVEANDYIARVFKSNKVSDSNERIFAFQADGPEPKPFK